MRRKVTTTIVIRSGNAPTSGGRNGKKSLVYYSAPGLQRRHRPLGDGEQNRDPESISRTRVSILTGESQGMQMIEEGEAIHELKFLMVGPSPPGLRGPVNILRNQSWLILISAPGL